MKTFLRLALGLVVFPLCAPHAGAQTLTSERIFPQETAARMNMLRGDFTAFAAGNAEAAAAAVASLAADGKQRNVLLLLPTVPVTFNSLAKDTAGDWRFGPAMTAGVGATFVLGKATYNGTAATVNPWIIAGAALNAGIREGENNEVAEALSISGFFGFGNVAVNFSRQLLGGGTSIGLALKVDALTNMAPDAYMCIRGCGRSQ